jgi:hypothetical protein
MHKKLCTRLSVWGIIFLLTSGVSWSDVPWTIVPITNTTISLPSNVTATVSYRVTNVSGDSRTLAMKPIAGVTQTTTGAGVCSNPFTLGDNGSCTLTLVIPGNGLTGPISNGPEVCITGSNGQPDSQMCYQSAIQSASLNITPVSAVVLGQSYGGGTVACLGGAPYLNLIAATANDVLSPIQWGGWGSNLPNAESVDDGATNTANIVATLTPAQAINTYAAGVCSEYTSGGYTDWFLPAQNQLACLCTNQVVVGGFAAGYYWSSTEIDEFSAWSEVSPACAPVNLAKFLNTLLVRCVRALTL